MYQLNVPTASYFQTPKHKKDGYHLQQLLKCYDYRIYFQTVVEDLNKMLTLGMSTM